MAELKFKAVSAWYEDGRICILMADKKEIRFPVELNRNIIRLHPRSTCQGKTEASSTIQRWIEKLKPATSPKETTCPEILLAKLFRQVTARYSI